MFLPLDFIYFNAIFARFCFSLSVQLNEKIAFLLFSKLLFFFARMKDGKWKNDFYILFAAAFSVLIYII